MSIVGLFMQLSITKLFIKIRHIVDIVECIMIPLGMVEYDELRNIINWEVTL